MKFFGFFVFTFFSLSRNELEVINKPHQTFPIKIQTFIEIRKEEEEKINLKCKSFFP